jgi:hypothetical protein
MASTHTQPDVMAELMAREGDLLPPVILSTNPVVPASSMTLAPFTTLGYVKGAAGTLLSYVEQPAASVTLSGSNGTYWLALHRDLTTPVASWTRRAGSHYLWQFAGAQPADPDGALVFASVTVAGVITAVTPLASRTPLAAGWRTHLGLGTMATQDATAVAITGGTATLATLTTTGGTGASLFVQNNPVDNAIAFYTDQAAGPGRYAVFAAGTAPSVLSGTLSVTGNVAINAAVGTEKLRIDFASGGYALYLRALNTGTVFPVNFANSANTSVGSISTTDTSTAYNTSSDTRLKEAIQPLTDALATVAALRPVRYRWQADASPGEGFLAHELMQHVPLAVSGLPDEVNPDGSVKPQQVDHSKIIVHLVGAIQELLARVETLEAALA